MKWLNKRLILIYASLFFIIVGAISIDFQATEFKQVDPEFRKSLELPSALGPSQAPLAYEPANGEPHKSIRMIINEITNQNYYQLNPFPMAVNKYLLYNNIDKNYNDYSICILVQATNNIDKTLENIDIYETAQQDLKIINCSVPIKASSLDESLRYIRGGKHLLSGEDISNPVGLANKLKENKHKSNLKTNFSINSNDLNSTKNNLIIKKINEFIANSELSNQTDSIEKSYISTQTKKMLELNKNKKLLEIDQQITNMLLIRDLYPSYIRKPDGYIEVVQEYDVEEDSGFIHMHLSKLRPKECLQFMYYANTSEHGLQETDTIIDIFDRTYLRMQIPLDVEFPSPRFNVRGDYSKQKVEPSEEIIIKYIIQLLNPENSTSEYSFNANIENSNDNITILPGSNMILNFSDDNYVCERTIKMEINEPGLYNVPSLSIDKAGGYFIIGEKIEVEPLWHKYILEITIMILAFCTIIGNNFRELNKKQNLSSRMGLAILALLIILTTGYLCGISTAPYYLISGFTIGSIIVWWWRNSL